MPELPEVETVARQLNPLLCGRRIIKVAVTDSKLHEPGLPRLTTARLGDRRIKEVNRSGKQVALALSPSNRDNNPAWLVVHLRMTGRLLYIARQQDLRLLKPRAVLTLDTGWLVFSDTRRFGTMRLYQEEAGFEPPGIDPLSVECTAPHLREMLAGSPQEIKAWLLRQDRLTGVGNIYACEALYAAGIDPRRAAGSLTVRESALLQRVLRRILRAAIRHCGTTFSDFQGASGSIGGYQCYLKAYGREGAACQICGTEIQRIVQQQRSTFYCPGCQS